MRIVNQPRIRRHAVASISLCALLLGAAVTAFAKKTDENSNRPNIRVISHLTLPGTPASQMVLQQENGREYLYMVRSSGHGYTIVDVTKPNHPSLVKKVDLPAGTSTLGLDVLGTRMGLVEESSVASDRAPQKPESVQFLDLSDPSNPHDVKTLTGVTGVLEEDGRHLVYIAKADGLWILQRPTQPTTHPCTSSDQISGFPECY
jgi:hypothetical protein